MQITRDGLQRLVEHISAGREVDTGKVADLLWEATMILKPEPGLEQTFEEADLLTPILEQAKDWTSTEIDIFRHCCRLLKGMVEIDLRRIMN